MSIAAKQRAKHKAKRTRVAAMRGIVSEPKSARVDKKANIIRGYKVMSLGEAKGHGNEVDQTTLNQIIELGQAAGDRGIKSRFTHPGLSSDGMGSYLGRSKNFRLSGESVIADLHLSDRAFDTPNGNLGKYVLDIAESDPDQFGASVVISLSNEKRLNKDGTPQKDADGNELLPVIRVESLHASDIVDDPAANEGFFSVIDDTVPDHPARRAFSLMDQLFGESEPGIVRDRIGHFVNSYLSNKGHVMPEVIKQNDTLEVPAITEAQLAAAKEEGRKEAILNERRRAAEITSLCQQAGKPEMAAGFLEDVNVSVADVQSKLFQVICQERKPIDCGGSGEPTTPVDPNAKYKSEYAADIAYFQKAKTSEEDYIASRRISDGLDLL